MSQNTFPGPSSAPAGCARNLRVRGLVQGVGFRHALCREARRLGLAGWVRNRHDGSVEAFLQGDAAAVVKWAVANNLTQFKKSTAQKAMEGRFNSVSKLNKAIERLEAGDVVRVEKVPNKGARPTTMIYMNPKLFKETT